MVRYDHGLRRVVGDGRGSDFGKTLARTREIVRKVSRLMHRQMFLHLFFQFTSKGNFPVDGSVACMFCLGGEENLEHLLLHCPFSNQIWQMCNRWLGILSVMPESCGVHFLQFGGELWTASQRRVARTGLDQKQNHIQRWCEGCRKGV